MSKKLNILMDTVIHY